MSADPVADAIAKTEQPVALAQFKGTLPSGKPFVLAIAADASDFDFLCLHGEVNSMRDQMVKARLEAQAGMKSIALPNGQRIPVAKPV